MNLQSNESHYYEIMKVQPESDWSLPANVYNKDKMNEIVFVGGLDLLIDVFNQFGISFPESLRNFKSALNRGDRSKALEILHQLKGTSLTLGMAELSREIEKAEFTLKTYISIDLSENLTKIESLFENFSTNKTKILQSYES